MVEKMTSDKAILNSKNTAVGITILGCKSYCRAIVIQTPKIDAGK